LYSVPVIVIGTHNIGTNADHGFGLFFDRIRQYANIPVKKEALKIKIQKKIFFYLSHSYKRSKNQTKTINRNFENVIYVAPDNDLAGYPTSWISG
jgi:hypothetical protein